jgi:diguanylate cyclase (GGDEF)-like protein
VTEIKMARGRRFIGVCSDISQEEADRERIEHLALHDTLTGLPNRANFMERLNALLTESASTIHALYFIDLDGFKLVNDNLGHDYGDEVLRIAASRLQNVLAKEDFVARLGGDEYVAIAYDIASIADAPGIGNRLLDIICKPMVLSGKECHVGASIGVAILPGHGDTASELISAADKAMYAAKRAGKGRVVMLDRDP